MPKGSPLVSILSRHVFETSGLRKLSVYRECKYSSENVLTIYFDEEWRNARNRDKNEMSVYAFKYFVKALLGSERRGIVEEQSKKEAWQKLKKV